MDERELQILLRKTIRTPEFLKLLSKIRDPSDEVLDRLAHHYYARAGQSPSLSPGQTLAVALHNPKTGGAVF